ncbi:MAG: nitroreductase family protein [Rhodospirillaceae bacterium]|nr:nitroreductase family protein [Rhodospirillaceae bacterium]
MNISHRVEAENGLNSKVQDSKSLSAKHKLYRLLPKSVFAFFRRAKYFRFLLRGYYFDYKHYAKWSSVLAAGDNKFKLQALITLGYHNLEKGLSLREPRPLFGREVVYTLLARLERYIGAFGWDKTSSVGFNVLCRYADFNAENGQTDPFLADYIEQLKAQVSSKPDTCVGGGTKVVSRESIHAASKIDLGEFFNARSSIRNFTPEKIDPKDLEKAVRWSQKTPSVCNRQSSRVYAIDGADDIKRLLDLQGGARGFQEQIPLLLVISSDISFFQSSGER